MVTSPISQIENTPIKAMKVLEKRLNFDFTTTNEPNIKDKTTGTI